MKHRPAAPRTASPCFSPLGICAAVCLTAVLAAPALAQGVFRIVGPDGRVTFSDQPPAEATSAVPLTGTAAPRNAQVTLPFELRQVVSRFPVTLFTTPDCAPCNSGRGLLEARGIPYSEKTVTTAQDSEALKRLSGDTALPFMTIGGQHLKGFSDAEWTRFLNAAGYPQRSVLPPGYRRAAPVPLVTVQVTEPALAPVVAPSTRPATDAAADIPVTPPPPNPAGIRF